MAVVVKQSGVLTTVQDCGRYGSQQYGVCVSGAMDQRSLKVANILLGNDRNAAALEVTMFGLSLTFEESCLIAVTGAYLTASKNGKPLPMYTAVLVEAGDTVAFGGPKTGCRAYVAFSGGLDVPKVFNSASTHLRSGMGGVEGRKLKVGDRLNLGKSDVSLTEFTHRVTTPERFASNNVPIRVVLGPQDDFFTDAGIKTLFSTPYSVTNECDRSGIRLGGAVIEHKVDGNIVSDATTCGSIQVPTSGLPIILMADCQTVGGYTKIGTVISADLPLLGQAKPGAVLNFRNVTVLEAQGIYVQHEDELASLEKSMRPAKKSFWSKLFG